MAGRLSTAKKLMNFLTKDLQMDTKEAKNILGQLGQKDKFYEGDNAERFLSHIEEKFKIARDNPQLGHTDTDPIIKDFLSVNNIGQTTWDRGYRTGTFTENWKDMGFDRYDYHDRYNQIYNDNLRQAVRGNFNYSKLNDIEKQMSTVSPESLAEKNGFSISKDGKLIPKSEELKIEKPEGALTQEDIDRVNKEFHQRKTPIMAFQREYERLRFAKDMGMDPKYLSLESMDRVKANIRENLDKASQGGSVNQIFLNQLDKDGAIRARQAAIDNANKNIADSQKILDEYENRLKEQGANSDVIQESFDTFNYLDQLAKVTDEQIAAQAGQTGSDVKNVIETMKAARTFAQNPTDEKVIADYVKTMQDKGLKGYDIENQTHIGKAYAAHVRLKQAQEDLEKIGSGKTLQETAAGSAQEAAVADAAADFSGVLPTYEQAMAGNGKVSLDRAMLRERMKGDPSSWGFDAAAEHLAKEQDTYLGKRIEEIKKSKASDAEKRKMFDDAIATVQKNVAEGPGMSNYFFGNQLHTGAVGAAAIVGTMGVAFGGRKSNAELYSSPF